MTTEHPITPPPELAKQWLLEGLHPWHEYVATQAARWGADQELEACCEWLSTYGHTYEVGLRAARRPKPPGLKLRIAEAIVKGDKPVALSLLDEALPDD